MVNSNQPLELKASPFNPKGDPFYNLVKMTRYVDSNWILKHSLSFHELCKIHAKVSKSYKE